jgi:hypothetical protein
MGELQGTNAWTMALLFGLGWLLLSGAVALALGRVIARSKDAGRRELDELATQDEGASYEAESAEFFDEVPQGTRTSGTRLRPVRLDDERYEPQRRVS